MLNDGKKYKCKQCGTMATAESFDAIVKMEKLCSYCIRINTEAKRIQTFDKNKLKREGIKK